MASEPVEDVSDDSKAEIAKADSDDHAPEVEKKVQRLA